MHFAEIKPSIEIRCRNSLYFIIIFNGKAGNIMSIRTDLALESAQQVSLQTQLEGVSQLRRSYKNIKLEVTEITVESEKAAHLLKKPEGRYITVESADGHFSSYSDFFDGRVKCIADEIKRLCNIPERVLVVGLGNRAITPDSLGPSVAEKIFATRHIKRLAKDLDTSELSDVAVLTTGVMAQTGVESSAAVKAICNEILPQLVIVIDALACSDLSHLGTTVQLCNTGISPGSGVENARKELSEETLGIPCVAVGVPTVTDMTTIAHTASINPLPEAFQGMIVTPKTIDNLIIRTSAMIAAAINKVLHPTLTFEEIQSLIM